MHGAIPSGATHMDVLVGVRDVMSLVSIDRHKAHGALVADVSMITAAAAVPDVVGSMAACLGPTAKDREGEHA